MAAAIAQPQARLHAEALFDSVGPAYEDAFKTCTPQQTSVNWLVTQLPANASVLDIGCGTGRPVCSSLADAGHSVLGIDVSGAMIDAAKQNVPNAKFEKADVKTFQLTDGTFDAITVYFSLIASVTQQEIKDTMTKIHQWLKPGGIFIFATVPISGENLEISWMGRPITVSSMSPEEVLDSMKTVGFEVLKSENSVFMPTAAEAGICGKEEVWEEPHLFVYAKKMEE